MMSPKERAEDVIVVTAAELTPEALNRHRCEFDAPFGWRCERDQGHRGLHDNRNVLNTVGWKVHAFKEPRRSASGEIAHSAKRRHPRAASKKFVLSRAASCLLEVHSPSEILGPEAVRPPNTPLGFWRVRVRGAGRVVAFFELGEHAIAFANRYGRLA